jgi:thiol-disulfide isomerase/thioredoxin
LLRGFIEFRFFLFVFVLCLLHKSIIMKQFFLFVMILSVVTVSAQPVKTTYDAVSLLKKVSAKLNSIKQVSYRYSYETRYYADNYHFLRNAGMYMEYTANSPIGLRFQAAEEKSDFIYNGSITMLLTKTLTIDSAAGRTAGQLDGNSYLAHSIAMLRNVLPLAISNDSIQKTARDTTIGQEQLYCIEMEGPKIYFGRFNGLSRLTVDDLRILYYLLVDKKTFLPKQFIMRYIRGKNDDRDFNTLIYSDIDLEPKIPAAESWEYTAYLNRYQPFKKPERKPVIPTGSLVADFTLPLYTPAAMENGSLKQYAGKVVLLDFWFKSCGPCMEAMPHYKELQKKMGSDFQLLTINIEDPVDDIKFFYNKYQPNYPMLFNGGKIFESLGLRGCPSSVLLDKSGKVAKVFFGFNEAEIGKNVQALLN